MWTTLVCDYSIPTLDRSLLSLVKGMLLVGVLFFLRFKPMLSKYYLFVILPNKDIQSKLFIQTKY
jgi:hypothetical protein